jgi:hypothetical protein
MRSVALTIAGALFLLACSKATTENYGKIEVGMKRDAVHQIIGKPNKLEGGGSDPLAISVEIWENGPQTITITFEGDVVAMKNIRSEEQSK